MAPVIDTCEPSRFTEPPLSSTVSLRASSGPLTVSGPVLVMIETAARRTGDVAAAGDGDAAGGDHDGAAGQIARAVADQAAARFDAQLAGAEGHRAARQVERPDDRQPPGADVDDRPRRDRLGAADHAGIGRRRAEVVGGGREGWGPEQQYGEESGTAKGRKRQRRLLRAATLPAAQAKRTDGMADVHHRGLCG